MTISMSALILTKQSNHNERVWSSFCFSRFDPLSVCSTHTEKHCACIYYVHTYVVYLYVCIFTRSIKWGLGAPSDKCLAISSANDVKRAKFMFQHDIDIFIYTHTLIHIQTHLYSSSSPAVRVRIVALAVWIFVCLWRGAEGSMTYYTTSEVKWPSNVLCRGTTHRIGSGRMEDYHLHWQLAERHDN